MASRTHSLHSMRPSQKASIRDKCKNTITRPSTNRTIISIPITKGAENKDSQKKKIQILKDRIEGSMKNLGKWSLKTCIKATNKSTMPRFLKNITTIIQYQSLCPFPKWPSSSPSTPRNQNSPPYSQIGKPLSINIFSNWLNWEI